MRSDNPIPGRELFIFLRAIAGQDPAPELDSDSTVCREAQVTAEAMPEYVDPKFRRLIGRFARRHMRQQHKAEKEK